jgi:Na+/H+-dicarboxylate symporter
MPGRVLTIAVVAAALFGWAIASWWPEVREIEAAAAFLKALFLGALKMIIAPLIFYKTYKGGWS